jgi:hypothetical protein
MLTILEYLLFLVVLISQHLVYVWDVFKAFSSFVDSVQDAFNRFGIFSNISSRTVAITKQGQGVGQSQFF